MNNVQLKLFKKKTQNQKKQNPKICPVCPPDILMLGSPFDALQGAKIHKFKLGVVSTRCWYLQVFARLSMMGCLPPLYQEVGSMAGDGFFSPVLEPT